MSCGDALTDEARRLLIAGDNAGAFSKYSSALGLALADNNLAAAGPIAQTMIGLIGGFGNGEQQSGPNSRTRLEWDIEGLTDIVRRSNVATNQQTGIQQTKIQYERTSAPVNGGEVAY